MSAVIGDKVLDNLALFALPVTTLLVGENGETYRIGDQYGEKTVIVHSRTGAADNEPAKTQSETDLTKSFGGYTLTVVWAPNQP